MARYRKKKQRVDLRNGGRVAYQRGGPNERVDQVRQDGLSGEMPIPTQRKPQTAPQPVAQTQAQQPIEQAPVVEEQVQQPVPTPAPTPTATPAATVTTPTTKAQPDNPLEGQSEVSSRIAGGERINQMEFYWVKPDGTTGKTTEGYSRVPKEFRNQVYLNQADAQQAVENFLKYEDQITQQQQTEQQQISGSPVVLSPEEQAERTARLQKASETVQAAAEGTLETPQIPQPEMLQEGPASEILEMGENVQVEGPTLAEDAKKIQPETVTAGVASVAPAPEQIIASTYTAKEIEEAPVINAQTGDVSPQAIAQAQSQALTKAATGVNVNDEKAANALAKRVVGVLSEGATAKAASIQGLDLPKVLRAKKQLRNAGLSEAQINEIGNDPEALEARLMDFTEEERGMIEGLPEEALVSNQMDSLLKGLDNGEVPTWARPAVAAVDQMLAARGMSASTVGRDALFNAIIQSALPIAQSNAQAIQQSVSQQKGIEAQAEIQNAQMRQQTALTNASNVFNMNMAQFTADQQTELSNSKFLQTVALTDATFEQQAVIQEAADLAKLDLATLDSNTKLAAQNAQSFLAMDMANLNNRQQTEVLKAQQEQQRLLSNQAAVNAAAQFNSNSENQTNQFMANLAQQSAQFNAQQKNGMEQFNVSQANAAEARRVANETDILKTDAALKAQIDQFNSQQEFAREQFNTKNAQAILQADVANRRRVNTANTAAINAVNQQNAQNAFGLTQQAVAFMAQELRDQADYAFRTYDNYEQRKASLYIAMLGNEGTNYEGGNWQTTLKGVGTLVDGFLGD